MDDTSTTYDTTDQPETATAEAPADVNEQPADQVEETATTPDGESTPPPVDPEALRESLARIVRQEQRVTEAFRQLESAKAAAKEAKESWEAEAHRLTVIIREETEPTLFDGEDKANADGLALEPRQPDDESWREVRLDTLDLPPGVIKALANNSPPIVTIGDHADYLKPTTDGFERRLTDIKGIGKGSVDRIDNALDVFWTEWRSRPVVQPEAESSPVADVATEHHGATAV